MVKRNFIRLLTVLLVIVLCAPVVFADAGQRLSVERQVYDYLTNELQLSTAAACGVLANIEHESSFQPNIYGDKGTSYGLCQWHNERFSALRSYCSSKGLDYRTVEGQMSYLRYELSSKYSSLLLTLQSIENTSDGAYRAAQQWCIRFERPSNMQVKAAQRGELARGKYWSRYCRPAPMIMIVPMPETSVPVQDPEIVIEQLKKNPVTIPMPPEEEQTTEGNVRHFTFEKPAFIYYTPRNLPVAELEPVQDMGWAYRALAVIGIAMVVTVIFPTKKRTEKLYRRDEDMVK